MFYYCTCSTDPKKRLASINGRTPFREVNVNNEGICVDCDHYTIASRTKYDNPKSIYHNLIQDISPKITTMVKGGLSIKNQRELAKKRRESDKRGKTKDGNLDVQ